MNHYARLRAGQRLRAAMAALLAAVVSGRAATSALIGTTS